MNSTELLKKIRKIEIKSKGLSNQIFAGEYHSAFKGKGMTFSEVREYAHGDDVRFIDWNVTARYGSPFIKTFEEEREMTVMLLIDVSASNIFGTNQQSKKDLITELSAVIAFSATTNNDKVGVVLFSDQVEKFIPPQKGKKHILRIIREILNFEPKSQKTDLNEALKFLSNAIKKKCTCFLLSDFISSDNYEKSLKLAGRKHDLIVFNIKDRREKELPDVGIVPLLDQETGELQWVDTSNKSNREIFEKRAKVKSLKLKDVFRKTGIDAVEIETGTPYTKTLLSLFKKRA